MTSRPWSCDTFVAMPDATASGAVLFGKNSDRPAGEAQPLRRMPARTAGPPLRLAYVTLDDAPAFAHVGSAPFWCWGYEIGVNERRVAIGNEAVFTRPWAQAVAAARAGDSAQEGLLGMELVRLGLERGATARAALDVMTELLERHGQWGSAMVATDHEAGSYDNSYIIADPHEAWVLETIGREWVARRTVTGTTAISNELTIRTDGDRRSRGLEALATDAGWWPETAGPLDVADAFTDPHTPLQVSHVRRRRAEHLLDEAADVRGVDLATAKAVLRDHLEDTFLGGPTFDASRPDFHTLCMHEHPSGFTWGNTAASLIVELHDDPHRPVVLWWSPVTPCTGIYLPIFVEADLPSGVALPRVSGSTDPRQHSQPCHDTASVWWQWQHLLDVVKDPRARDFVGRSVSVRAAFDTLEQRWVDQVPSTRDAAALSSFAADCLEQARTTADGLVRSFGADPARAGDPRWTCATGH